MALAPRLAEWVAAWRQSAAVLAAVQGGVRDSIGARDQPPTSLLVTSMPLLDSGKKTSA